MSAAIGVDIGGTFTDLVLAGPAHLRFFKFPSSPRDPAQAVLHALTELLRHGELQPQNVHRLAHGSTIATNALLEGKLGKTALLTTAGFRDVLEIGRQARPNLYDLHFTRPEPLVPRHLRLPVRERIDAQGQVVLPLDPEEVREAARQLRQAQVQSVAICFLFSFRNPAHEHQAGQILAQELNVPITLSSQLLPEFREFERCSTTVINAALRPVVGSYLRAVEEGSQAMGFPGRWLVMQSSGAVTHAETAQREPARIVLSGPAAGVEGARAVGRLAGFENLITLDMGGTSCDVSLVQTGEAPRTTGGQVAGYPLALPKVDVHTIGAGGGSIAWVDAGGALRVGPHSAGAEPGPACFGRGGQEPTVTDAHLVLGHLLPDFPLGNLPRLDVEKARAAVAHLARNLGLSLEAAARGILEVADAAMERAIRVISVERGHDPRDFALLAFGGAGPLHAVALARRLSIPTVLVPRLAGVLSALGLLLADLAHEESQGLVQPLRSVSPGRFGQMVHELCARARDELAAYGQDVAQVRVQLWADLRYVGQAHELEIPLPQGEMDEVTLAALEREFHAEHASRYGHAAPEEPVELVALRARAFVPAPPLDLRWQPEMPPRQVPKTLAWFSSEGPVETEVVFREALGPGAKVKGPAILLGCDSTVLVPPDCMGEVDPYGTLVLRVG